MPDKDQKSRAAIVQIVKALLAVDTAFSEIGQKSDDVELKKALLAAVTELNATLKKTLEILEEPE